MYGIEYLPFALRDLENIVRFIAFNYENPPLARKIKKEIQDSLKMARRNPLMYQVFPFENINPKYPSTDLYEYRKIIVRNYLVFYVVDEKEKKLVVVRVINGRLDYMKEF